MNLLIKKIAVFIVLFTLSVQATSPIVYAQSAFVDNDESNAQATGGRSVVTEPTNNSDQTTFIDNDESNAQATGGRNTYRGNDIEATENPQAQATELAKSSQSGALDLNATGICSPWYNFLTFRCLGYGLYSIGAFVAWMGGMFLNLSIEISIINMRALVSDLGAVNVAWDVLRDLANIFFIFILLYIAIITITGLAQGSTYRMLISVILVAMFLNFSLFFTKVIVDASNIISVQFYNSIVKGGDNRSDGISWVFTEGSRISSIFKSPQDGASYFKSDTSKIPYLTYGLMALIFCIILAFAFFAIGILFLIRLVMIIYLMILSPIALLGHTIPKLKPMWDDWWDNLLNQALFAPAMMIMLWVTAMIVNSEGFMSVLGSRDQSNSFANISLGQGLGGSVTVIVNFAILIALLIGGMVIAKKFGTWGSSAVVGTFDKWSRKAVYTPFRLGARGAIRGLATTGRATVGRYAYNKLSKMKGLEKVAATGGIVSRTLARGALATTKGVAKSSFDIRATGVGGTVSDTLGLGKAKEGGWKGYVDSQEKKEKSFAESLKSNIYASDEIKAYVDQHKANAESKQKVIAELQEQIAEAKKAGKDTANLEENLIKAIKERDASLKSVKDIDDDRSLATAASREFVRKSAGTIWDKIIQGGAVAHVKEEIDKKFDKGDTKWASDKELANLEKELKAVDAKLEADKAANLSQDDVVASINEKINKNLEKIAEYNKIIAEAEEKRANNIYDPEIRKKADKALAERTALETENNNHSRNIGDIRQKTINVNEALEKAAKDEKDKLTKQIKDIKGKKDKDDILSKIKKLTEEEDKTSKSGSEEKKSPDNKGGGEGH